MDPSEGDRSLQWRCLALVVVAAILSRLLLAFIPPLFGVGGGGLYCQFDCGWYRTIATAGYHLKPAGHDAQDAANWAFFPLFPLSVKLARWLVAKASYVDAAAAINSALFVLSCVLLYKINLRYASPLQAALGSVAFAFFPISFYFYAPYTESWFLFLSVLGLYFLQRKQFIRAGVAAAFLSATRNQGIFFAVVILAYGIEAYLALRGEDLARRLRLGLDVLLALVLTPVGMILFAAYLYWLVGDALAFVHVQRAWGRGFENPLWVILGIVRLGDPYGVYALFTFILAGIAVTWLAWMRRYGEAAFAALCVLSAGISGSFSSMPRYVLASVGLALFVTAVLPRLPRPVFWVFLAGEVVLLAAFVGQWFRGATWLV
ncbi:mannosyltransferase family protein [Microvirga pudoricolor]|uniref:mannosyltransferase family protein n=1 Tax=Microvirga pudoricolor TaxID=2778729 RepID=UPI001950E4CE|nr:mannosyltransferase family protein [Microvirga pudoricolor]MBM6594327.1 hypothetical protein [Microvirga pudoricolor]